MLAGKRRKRQKLAEHAGNIAEMTDVLGGPSEQISARLQAILRRIMFMDLAEVLIARTRRMCHGLFRAMLTHVSEERPTGRNVEMLMHVLDLSLVVTHVLTSV